MLDRLVLKDDELDDVILPREDFISLKEEARWMAVVKVHTTKQFSNQPFFQKMDVAWGLARKWTIRPVEDNLFVLQVSCLGDWNRVMLEGPWLFRQMGVMLEPYDGMADPLAVTLNHILVWAQIRGVPPLFRKEAIVRDMAARLGEVLGVDLYALGASGTSFVRVRIKLDVNKPLVRAVGLHPEGQPKLRFQVLYEKLPRFCDVCGILGHGDMECGDGVHTEEAKEYGDWMMAPQEDWHPQTTGVRRGPAVGSSGGGRGGGRAAGRGADTRKRPTGVHSGKASQGDVDAEENSLMLVDGGEKRGQQGMEVTGDLPALTPGPQNPLSPIKPPVMKKQRTSEENKMQAGSNEECRQDP
ncbi:hypothetical protein QYE76_017384 [Lolium multiflorum]|uniref:Zinc knuckle CX2CX4HX4C domain-containing protein n=1 Tax=Lolium multiflorum TaxID=4521 RepID=A0AAD8PR68_LOLMU|nr:hypothetical protein QYE76_017384 [Lolium multiflorum]